MIGTLINDRYRLDAELGRGGMGTVYRAHDLLLGRDVATKILVSSALGTEGRTRLLSEARAAAQLNHPNIVSIYDAGETDNTPYIVMELVEGESPLEYCQREMDKVLIVAQQIAAALDHAHAHNIIHRDLKPENVIVTPAGKAKLMDFGLARSVASRLTTEDTVIGTVFYLAPEQALGQDLDGRADLYALGAMLYELTTGQLPFTATSPVAVISQHLHAPVVPPSTYNAAIPPALDALILRLMNKRPEDRPDSAAAVRQELAHLRSAAKGRLSAGPAPALLDRLVRGRLVGRESDFAEAKAVWQRAISDTQNVADQVLLVSGEPGIGKTRFVRELATLAEVLGSTILTGECYSQGSAPYAPISQIVREVLSDDRTVDGLALPDLVLADLLTLVPDLRPRYPQVQPNPSLDPQAEQQRLFESMVALCTALAQRTPLLLVVEDVHWADGGTLLLVQYLARRSRMLGTALRIFIILTYREVELVEHHPLNDLLLYFHREQMAVRIKLGRLSRVQTGELLRILFAGELPPEFVEKIYRETEGNPFFIEEVCKALVEEGKLYRDNGHWKQRDLEEIRIPQSVRLAIQSRMGKLSTQAQDVLRLAAIIGREFDFAILHSSCDLSEETLIDSLEEAERAQLIDEIKRAGREAFSFAHGLVPATLRESVSGLRRHRLHQRVAAAFERLRPDDLEALAYHHGEAGNEGAALAYIVRAADRAARIYANEEAIRLYSEALAFTPRDHPERFDLLAARARIYDLVARREEQYADVQAMSEIAHKLGDQERLFDSLIALTDFYLDVDFTQAGEAARQAADVARALGDPVREGLALRRLGEYARSRHDLSESRSLLEEAAQRFQDANLPAEAAGCFHELSLVLVNMAQHAAAHRAAEQALSLSRAAEDRRGEATSLRRRAIVYLYNHQHQESLPFAQAALELHRELGDRSEECNALNVLGLVYFWTGDLEKAHQFVTDSLELGNAVGSLAGILNAIDNLTVFYRAEGKYEAGLHFLEEQLADAHCVNDPLRTGAIDALRAEILASLGQYEAAFSLADSSLKTASALGSHAEIRTLSWLGRWHADLGDYEKARHYLDQALQLGGEGKLSAQIMPLLGQLYLSYLQGTEPILQSAVESAQEVITSLRGTEWRMELAEALVISAGLHIKLAKIDGDPAYLKHALACTTESLQLNASLPQVPAYVFYLHSLALRGVGRPAEARDYLRRAHDQVMSIANRIEDPAFRSGWLDQVWLNREIVSAWRSDQGSASDASLPDHSPAEGGQ